MVGINIVTDLVSIFYCSRQHCFILSSVTWLCIMNLTQKLLEKVERGKRKKIVLIKWLQKMKLISEKMKCHLARKEWNWKNVETQRMDSVGKSSDLFCLFVMIYIIYIIFWGFVEDIKSSSPNLWEMALSSLDLVPHWQLGWCSFTGQ